MTAHPPVAVIDLGSNSVLLLVAARSRVPLLDVAKITRLGEGVFASGRLSVAAKERTRKVVNELSGRARELGAERVIGLGTEALRRAEDGAEFLADLCERGGLSEARLLSGEQEAALTFEASARGAAAADSLVVLDVGGGSTELAWRYPGCELGSQSLLLGSVRLTEALVSEQPIRPADLERIRATVQQEIRGLERPWSEHPTPRVVAVAGTATTLAALELRLEPYAADAVEGLELTRSCLSGWIERLAGMAVEARAALPGLEPGRADVIVAGLMVLQGVLEFIGVASFSVSGKGVRHGAALRLLEGRRLV